METSKALASVLEVSVADLLVDDRSVLPSPPESDSDKVLPYITLTFVVAFSLGYWLG